MNYKKMIAGHFLKTKNTDKKFKVNTYCVCFFIAYYIDKSSQIVTRKRESLYLKTKKTYVILFLLNKFEPLLS